MNTITTRAAVRRALLRIGFASMTLVLAGHAAADYYIVVGSYKKEAVAAEQAELTSTASGNTLHVVPTDVRGSVWYRVVSGPFSARGTALGERERWVGIGYPETWVTYREEDSATYIPGSQPHIAIRPRNTRR